MKTINYRKRIRLLLIFFSVALLLSGLTAIPVQWEITLLSSLQPIFPSSLNTFILQTENAIRQTSETYPFIFYGFDWLAFAHIIIAIFFIGAIKDPIQNIWIIDAGIAACFLIFPFAFCFGTMRGIPIGWIFVDCSFGIFGMIPLLLARKYTIQLKKLELKKLQDRKNKTDAKAIPI
jgi:hypothetical protein